MNNEEAEFILAAYRPDGRDAHDDRFAEALAQVQRDPELRAWWQRQRAFDAAVAAKIAAVAPPPGLRATILAGGRASGNRRRAWKLPAWLAAAAALVFLATIAVTLNPRRGTPNLQDLAAAAMRDLADAHGGHTAGSTGIADLEARLASAALPLSQTLRLDLADIQRRNCRTLRIAGREVFEICFQRDGTWFHLYAARRAGFEVTPTDTAVLQVSRGEYAGAAWSDAANVYALVTNAGAAALRRVI